jgi:heat shock protein HtpX
MFEDQIRSNINRTWVLVIGFIVFFTVLMYLAGWFFSYYYDNPDLATYFLIGALAFTLLSSWGSYYYSDRIVISSVGARPADRVQHKRLHDMAEGLQIAAGLPVMPKLYVMNDPSPNAFATGRNPAHSAIVVTTGLLDILKKDELEGVLAHEMGHILNYDILLATLISVLVGTVILISHFFWRWMWYFGGGRRRGGGGSGGGAAVLVMLAIAIVFLILAPIAAQLIQLAVSRKREFLADATSAKLTRYPEGLAKALQKISSTPTPVARASKATAHMFIDDPLKKPKRSSWLTNLFSTHPPIDERVSRLLAM